MQCRKTARRRARTGSAAASFARSAMRPATPRWRTHCRSRRGSRVCLEQPSVDARTLAAQLGLHAADVEMPEILPGLQRDGRCDTRPLTTHRAAHHVADRSVRDLVAADTAAGDYQPGYPLWDERPIWDVKIPPRGRQD